MLLAGCVGPKQPDPSPAADATRRIIDSGGNRRSYWLLPSDAIDRPRPLLIVLHWTGGSGAQMVQLGKFAEHARRHGYLLVAPDALGQAFNDGSGRIGRDYETVDDVLFLRDVIEDVRAAHRISQVFVAGFTSGAAMAQRLAAEAPDAIDAAAGVAGHLWPPLFAVAPRTAQPVPLLLIFGDSDPLNPLSGGPVTYPGGRVLDKPSPARTLKEWARRYGCTTRISASAAALRTTNWYGCKDGVPLELTIVSDLGHYWPGGTVREWPDVPASVVGPYAGSIDATDEIWQFFTESVNSRSARP